VIGLLFDVAVLVSVPLVQLATYEVIAEPPLEAGVVNATTALALPAVTVPMIGAEGTTDVGVSVTVTVTLHSSVLSAFRSEVHINWAAGFHAIS
jgi:hypothetical protein